ncbi:hypothetical protein ACFL59_16390, partial [Planctomycetota bacterium]
LKRVRAFIQSLGMVPYAYFGRSSVGKRSDRGFFYPRAFLAALPTGEMVRQLRGEGGLLNKLSLEFSPGVRIPISRDTPPLVELEPPKRRRTTFNRILTAIRDSFGTAVRGTALVLSGDAAQAAGNRPPEPTSQISAPPPPPSGS